MALLIKRFYSSTFKSVRPPIFFKHNHLIKKKKEKESHIKTISVKEMPLKDKTQMEDKCQLDEHFKSSDLLKVESVRKSNIKFEVRNKSAELLYGIHPVLLAIKSNRRSFFNAYFKETSLKNNIKLQEIEALCQKLCIPTNYINKNRFTHLLGQEKLHQGVCIEATKLNFIDYENYSEDEKARIFKDCMHKYQLWLYLDQINDPMNFGAILRTAYYFGTDKVFTSATDSCPITSVVSKASSGVAEILPVHQILNVEHFFQSAQNYGWQIVSSSAHSTDRPTLPLEKFQGAERILLIVGNEGRGVSPVVERHSNIAVTIPHASNCIEDIQSLNVSVATSIILHFLSSRLNRNG